MKSFFTLALVFVLAAGLLTGCRGQETDTSSTTNPSSSSTTQPSQSSTQSTAPSSSSTAPSSSSGVTESTGEGKLMPHGPRMPRY